MNFACAKLTFLAGLALAASLWAGPLSAQDRAENPVTLTITERALQDALETSGGRAVLRYRQGDKITLIWETDEATELHLHGYDIDLDLEPGQTAQMEFDAKFTGRFAIEAHRFGTPEEDDAGHNEGKEEEVILIYIEVLPN